MRDSAPPSGMLPATVPEAILRVGTASLLLSVLAFAFPSPACHAGELRIAAWNLEHLN